MLSRLLRKSKRFLRQRSARVTCSRRLVLEPLEDRRLMAVTPGTHLATGTHVTTYTLALAATGELTQAAGGKAAAKALLNQFVGELNQLFGTELAVQFQLHPQNDNLIFENPATDGYTNGVVNTMVLENPVVINTALNGSPTNDSGYDFGHVLGLGNDGGFAGTGIKARGATDLSAANASRSSIKSFAHELGHQLGSSHSFNGVGSQCAANRNAPTAVEPGSGSTLMAYQGICDADNLPELPGDGAYLHAVSFHEMVNHLTNAAGSLGTRTATGNSLPSVNAGADRTIPAATPFTLSATASDPNAGDQLTFTWEQIDANSPSGISVPIANAQDQSGPLFRSYAPTSDASRSFPRIEDLIGNVPSNQNKNEHLPTQNRVMNFRVTARDNHQFNGRTISGIQSDDVKLTVVNTGAPFQVTTWNNSGQSITGGSQQTITWNVAGTTGNGIDTSRVDILLSVDGGLTYPLKLASQTNNDGSETVTLPNVQASKARIKVQADPTQNVFFDINDADFQLTLNPNASGGILVTESSGSTKVAEGAFVQTGLAATDTYTVALTQPATSEVDITITSDSQTLVSLDGTNFSASRTVTIPPGDTTPRTITVKALNDSAIEGVHRGTVRQAVTRSTDPSYNPQVLIAGIVPSVVTHISDDESPPLIGVELDFDNPASVPVNWTRVSNPFGINVTDLIRENGDTTMVDFSIQIANPAGGAGWSFRTMDPSTVPAHSPDISLIDDVMFWAESAITATWSGLKAASRYRVYVFAASEANVDSEGPIKQTVTITGNGNDNPAPFLQDGTRKVSGAGNFKELQLFVNGTIGSRATPLEQYGLTVTSTADGKISVQVNPSAGGHSVLSALAIQEVLDPLPEMAVTETQGNTEVSESGTTDTFSVTLTSQPSANVVIQVMSSNTAEATVAPASLTFTPQNWNTAQVVTVTGVDDQNADGNVVSQVTLTVSPQTTPPLNNIASRVVHVTTMDNEQPARPWQNSSNRFDVSGDGAVVPLDVLRVINELNEPKYRDAQGKLPDQRPAGISFYDVNGDGFATTNDALQVINFLNGGGAEGESGGRMAWGPWLAAALAAEHDRWQVDLDWEQLLEELAAAFPR